MTMPNRKLSVLLVDDSKLYQMIAINTLQQCGVTKIDTAMNGFECLDRIRNSSPDVVMLDLNMPKMDGVEVLLQSQIDGMFPPIIICSSSDQKTLNGAREVASLKGVRIVGVLKKPYSASALGALLARVGDQIELGAANGSQALDPDYVIANMAEKLHLVFQPQVSVETGATVGVEALARWHEPGGIVLSPAAFVQQLEESGKIGKMSRLVIERALAVLAEWRREGIEMPISINISADDAVAPDFVEFAATAVAAVGIEPSTVTFELTETRIALDFGRMLSTLTRLRLRGFGLSIDDFGCGTSSLQQLRQAPFNELKIDRQFVTNLSNDPQNYAIVESCIDLGKRLGLAIVAEGIEAQEDMIALRKLNCQSAQGYLMSRPLSADDFAEWLATSLTAA
jgi:EAL domain-containing protein (putative c-di-GMP-specific phosphodiesterase class I)